VQLVTLAVAHFWLDNATIQALDDAFIAVSTVPMLIALTRTSRLVRNPMDALDGTLVAQLS